MRVSGFTLVESIIYIGVVGLLAVGLVYYASSVSSLGGKLASASEVQANARVIALMLAQKVREADAGGASTVYDSDDGVLELLMEEPTENPTTIYRTQGGMVEITRGAGAPVRLTSQKVTVTKLRFTEIDETIRLELEIEYRDAGSAEYKYEYALSTTLAPRK